MSHTNESLIGYFFSRSASRREHRAIGNLSYRGDTLYSYAMPIAHIDRSIDTVFITSTSSTPTTNRHITMAYREATQHHKTFAVPDPEHPFDAQTFEYYADKVQTYFGQLMNSRCSLVTRRYAARCMVEKYQTMDKLIDLMCSPVPRGAPEQYRYAVQKLDAANALIQAVLYGAPLPDAKEEGKLRKVLALFALEGLDIPS